MVKSGNSTIVRSAARALDVLEIVVQAEKAPTFTMIQKASGIPKSSLSYLMQELVQKRYVQYDPEVKVYYPGLALLALSAFLRRTDAGHQVAAGRDRGDDSRRHPRRKVCHIHWQTGIGQGGQLRSQYRLQTRSSCDRMWPGHAGGPSR